MACPANVICVTRARADTSSQAIRNSTIEHVFLIFKGNRPLFCARTQGDGAFWRALVADVGAKPGLLAKPAQRQVQVHPEEYADARDLGVELGALLGR